MSPALIADTDPAMRINTEEVFGPVVSTVRIKNYDEALDLANRGNFGLSAGIVTTSHKHARHFRRHVRAGMVMVNLPTAGVDYHVPFRSEEQTSELQSLMRISYAVFCLKQKNINHHPLHILQQQC